MSHDYRRLLEPDARDLSAYMPAGEVTANTIALSQAISLKRIADALASLSGPDAQNEYGESPFAAIGGGITRALRDKT